MSATPHRHRFSCSRRIDRFSANMFGVSATNRSSCNRKAPMQTCTMIQKSEMVKFASGHSRSVHPKSGILLARNAIADMRHQIPGILTQTATRERRFHNLNDSQQRR
jgi:hypothetical protein